MIVKLKLNQIKGSNLTSELTKGLMDNKEISNSFL